MFTCFSREVGWKVGVFTPSRCSKMSLERFPQFKVYFSLIVIFCESYTRDFNLDQNTHLVIEVAQGAKYQLAASHSKICIVTPTWLEECEQQGRHVEEGLFPVIPYGGGGGGSRNNKSSFLPESIHRTHDQIFDIIGKETNFKRLLFECHQFYLMGFEDSPDIKQRLGCIIRRGGGTIHWELSDDVTTLVIYDTCHDALRYV